MGEQPLPKHGACCLSSVNLSEFVVNPYTNDAHFNASEFEKAVSVCVRTLDKLIDENYYRHPLKEQQAMSYNYRNIGCGVFGYATMLAMLGMEYGSEQAIAFSDNLFDRMFQCAFRTSVMLAKKLGKFPKYTDKVFDSTIVRRHFTDEEIEEFKKYGLRNCSILSIAPTGSIATTLNESGGLEPYFAMKYTRRTVGMTNGQDTYYDVYCKAAQGYMDAHHTKDLPYYFVASQDIPWDARVRTQGVIQKHIDTAISSTVNLPESATKDDIAQLYLLAWKEGLKGITIFRDNCKRLGILTTGGKTESDESENTELKRGEITPSSDNLVGKKRKIISGCGSLHCEAFFDPNTGALMETYFSKGSTGGCLSFMNGLSRMISLSARAGVDVHHIVDQLFSVSVCPSYAVRKATKHDVSKGSCCPTAIANALLDMYNEMQSELSRKCNNATEHHVEETETNSVSTLGVCPECGEHTVREGGCVQCKNCGWSKCD